MQKTQRIIYEDVYKADDGRIFDDKQMCRLYEINQKRDNKNSLLFAIKKDDPYLSDFYDYEYRGKRMIQHEDEYYSHYIFSKGFSAGELDFSNAFFADIWQAISDCQEDYFYNYSEKVSIGKALQDHRIVRKEYDDNSWSFKESDKKWSNKQKSAWKKIINHWDDDYYKNNELFSEALSLITGEAWKTEAIHGCCQGDARYIIYDSVRISKTEIEHFESEFFNLGCWYEICESGEYFSADESGYSFYIHDPYSSESVRSEIAAATGCQEENIIIQDDFNMDIPEALKKEISA